MVILLQLCIFLIFAVIRGRFLFGRHLSAISPGSQTLDFTYHAPLGHFTKHVGLCQRDGIPFVIRREKWYHRALKANGIASEISAGDCAFDQRYFITTDFPGHLEQLLASEELLMQVQKLFQMRGQVAACDAKPDLVCDPKRLLARAWPVLCSTP